MTKRIISVAIIIFFVFLSGQSQAQIGEVVASFSAPADKPTGMAYDGQYLWNADIGTNKIYQIDPETGSVIYVIPGPADATINGLTWDGNFLWCSDRQNNCLHKINVSDSSIVQILYLQTSSPRGLAYDGNYIWYQDSEQKSIFKLDPATGAYMETLTSPDAKNRGLCYDGSYLWSSDRNKNELYLIDPHRGSVIMILSTPGTYAYGLAYDGEFLWNADFETDTIYKLSIQGSEKYKISDPLQVRIRYSATIKNVGSSTMTLKTFMACPFETIYQLLDDSLIFYEPPHSFFSDKYDQRIAYYEDVLLTGEQKHYQWSLPTTLYNIQYFLHPDSVGTIEEIPQSILDMYLTEGEKYYITHPSIIAAVQQAIGDETNLYWQVRKIHDYVIEHLYYLNDDIWATAPDILNQGQGSCSEYSFLFIALCRAAGIPARYEAGGHLRDDIPYEDRIFHRWQQVYFPRYGWVPIDCTWDDKNYPGNQARYFGRASNEAFSTTIGGGGEYGLWWNYNCENSRSGGAISRNKLMEWLPYTSSVEVVVERIHQNYKKSFNYPNPFNSETNIQFYLPDPTSVKITVFNQLGQLIKNWNEKILPTGWHSFFWDGKNTYGFDMTSGIYFYRIVSNDFVQNGRMMLLR